MKLRNFFVFAALMMPLQAMAQEAGGALNVGLAVIGGGLAGLGAAIGIGILGGRLLEAVARQPELESKLKPNFFLAAGLTDAVPIIALVFAILVVLGVFG